MKLQFSDIKRIFLEFVSFDSPRAMVFNLSAIIAALAIIPTSALSYSPVKCVFKNFLLPLVFGGNCPTSGIFAGCECPACGLTRSVSRLLHGDLAGSLDYNVMGVFVLGVMVVLIAVNAVRIMKQYRKR